MKSLKRALSALAIVLALGSVSGAQAQSLSPEVRATMEAARIGDPQAMSELGRRYLNGIGIKQDEDQALEWFLRAAELDEPEAMYQLGFMFETGIRVKKDKAKAVWYYERAAELGHRGAQSILQRLAPDRTV